MEHRTLERCGFLLIAFLFVAFGVSLRADRYGNSETAMKRYIFEEAGEHLGEYVELLAVEDIGRDRIVIFRRETKRPDEVWFVRFRQNEDGNYEGYAPATPQRMYCAYPGSGIYSEAISGWYDDATVYYTVWSENPKLDTMTFQLDDGAVQEIKIEENPSLTVIEFQSRPSGFGIRTTCYDSEGNEIM